MSDYPSEELLKSIEEYDLITRPVEPLLTVLEDNWKYADVGYYNLTGKQVLRLELHTGGWSGNEDIIRALRKNKVFFSAWWTKEERGGHYYFKIRRFIK